MPSTTLLIDKLRHDFPTLTFVASHTFRWSPDEQAVFYADSTDTTSLLHEVAHGALQHTHYVQDIELLQMERDAWDYTLTTLAQQYGIVIDHDQAEILLDTYRDWLHSRSLCPTCHATGMQTAQRTYSCLSCGEVWKVNEARSCALRRSIQK